MKYFLASAFVSALVLAACQQKDSAPAAPEVNEADITADVLSKVASKIEYRYRQNSLTISNDGSYRLIYDARVQKTGSNLKAIKRDEARCLLDFSGRISFFKNRGTIPAGTLLTLSKMTLTGTSVIKSEATENTAEGTDPNELCHAYQFAAIDQREFESHVLSYDPMAVVFTEINFNVKNKTKAETETSHLITFSYNAAPYSDDKTEFDIVRLNMPHNYFVTNAGAIDVTETAFQDIQGSMNCLKPLPNSELGPAEITIGKEKDLKTVSVFHRQCKLEYMFYILNVRVRTDGLFMKLLAGHNDVPAELSEQCAELNNRLMRLGSETKIKYANHTKMENDPDNYLTFYIKLADNSLVPMRFSSK